MTLTLTRDKVMTWYVDNFFKIKENLKNLKIKNKSGADTCHVLFKNVNYLNTVSKKINGPKFHEKWWPN